jgi:hypothetical protein
MKWQKNIRKIPQNILDLLDNLVGKNIIAACTVKFREEDIKLGEYAHLGLSLENGKVAFPETILPNTSNGHYSYYNVHGQEKVLHDLPMTTKSYTLETPNFGDWSKGSHSVDLSRWVYQREYFGPKYREIKIELLGMDAIKGDYLFKFTVDEVLNPDAKDFTRNLFFCLNLLQENTGNHNVFSTDASYNDYLKSLYVSWEILPPGEAEESANRILTGNRSQDPQIKTRLIERYKFLLSLHPQNMVQGMSGFIRYFGAQFADDLIVFENIEYGNAIYVMFDKWAELSMKPRNELMATGPDGYVRIPHAKTWKMKLRSIVKRELKKRNQKLL